MRHCGLQVELDWPLLVLNLKVNVILSTLARPPDSTVPLARRFPSLKTFWPSASHPAGMSGSFGFAGTWGCGRRSFVHGWREAIASELPYVSATYWLLPIALLSQQSQFFLAFVDFEASRRLEPEFVD